MTTVGDAAPVAFSDNEHEQKQEQELEQNQKQELEQNQTQELQPELQQEPESEQEQEKRSPIFESRVERAEELRLDANGKFREGNIVMAMTLYERALYHIDFDELSFNYELMDKHRDLVLQTRLPIFLNLAACHLRDDTSQDRATAAHKYASSALKIDPDNAKGLYLRGKASLRIGKLQGARKDLLRAAELKPNDKLVREALRSLRVEQRDDKRREARVWKGKLLSSRGQSGGKSKGTDESESDAAKTPATVTTSPERSSLTHKRPFSIFLSLIIACLAVAISAFFWGR
eukprot:g2459.t1